MLPYDDYAMDKLARAHLADLYADAERERLARLAVPESVDADRALVVVVLVLVVAVMLLLAV